MTSKADTLAKLTAERDALRKHLTDMESAISPDEAADRLASYMVRCTFCNQLISFARIARANKILCRVLRTSGETARLQ